MVLVPLSKGHTLSLSSPSWPWSTPQPSAVSAGPTSPCLTTPIFWLLVGFGQWHHHQEMRNWGQKVYLETYMTLPEILVVPAGYILAQVLILIWFL